MILVDMSIVSVATPAIMAGLNTDIDTAVWVTSGADGGDGGVVLVVGGVEEGRVGLQHPGQIKRADVEDPAEVDLRLGGGDDLGEGVDLLETVADVAQVGVGHQVGLVEHDTVGEGDLFDGLVLHPIGFDLVEVGEDVLGVHQGDDRVQAKLVADLVVDEERPPEVCADCATWPR